MAQVGRTLTPSDYSPLVTFTTTDSSANNLDILNGDIAKLQRLIEQKLEAMVRRTEEVHVAVEKAVKRTEEVTQVKVETMERDAGYLMESLEQQNNGLLYPSYQPK